MCNARERNSAWNVLVPCAALRSILIRHMNVLFLFCSAESALNRLCQLFASSHEYVSVLQGVTIGVSLLLTIASGTP